MEADDAADHLMTERRAVDLEAEHPVPQVAPVGSGDPTHQRDLGTVAALGASTERREIVLADQGIAGQTHRCKIERVADPPHGLGEERARHRGVEHLEAITAPDRREASAEVVGDDPGITTDHLGLHADVDDPRDALGVGLGFWHVERQHLTPGVDPGIGSTGHDDVGVIAEERSKRVGQLPHDGPDAGIRSQAAESPAVVRDQQRNANERTRGSARFGKETQSFHVDST